MRRWQGRPYSLNLLYLFTSLGLLGKIRGRRYLRLGYGGLIKRKRKIKCCGNRHCKWNWKMPWLSGKDKKLQFLQILEQKKNTKEYEEFSVRHNCLLNHKGSSGFINSVCFDKLRYTTYVGGGDTKSYTNVVQSNPYPCFQIEKAECVGHVQGSTSFSLR